LACYESDNHVIEFYGHIQATDSNGQEVLIPYTSELRIEGVTAGTHTALARLPNNVKYELDETVANLLASMDALRNDYLSAVSGVPHVITVDAKTGNYTITAGDSGKMLTTRGASGAVTFTLPTVTAAFTGVDLTLFNAVDQNMGVSAQTAGQIMFKNDVAANSVTYQTATELIGGALKCVCDGVSWLVIPLAEENQTLTVVT
jgi:hypothetical protein